MQTIKEMIDSGMSMLTIARKLNIDRRELQLRVNSALYKHLTPAEHKRIIRLYESGKSGAEIARKTNLHVQRIYYELRKAGVPRRKGGPIGRRWAYSDDTYKQIQKALKTMTWDEVAEKFNTPKAKLKRNFIQIPLKYKVIGRNKP